MRSKPAKQYPTSDGRARPNALPMLGQKMGDIVYRPISELKPYRRKLRKHSKQKMRMIEESICAYGFIFPVLVEESGTIIAGEARVEAARSLNMRMVPTLSVTHLRPKQIQAYRIADNKLASPGGWEDTVLRQEMLEILSTDEISIESMGWVTTEVDLLLDDISSSAAGADPADDVPEVAGVLVSRPGDLWVLGKHRVLCASSLDARAWARLMEGQVAAMGFTDPPYNVPINGHVSGRGKAKHAEFQMASGEMSEGQFGTFCETYLSRMTANLQDGALLANFMDWKHVHALETAARRCGLTLFNLCVWNKTNAGMGSLWRSKHELVPIFKKGRGPHVNNVKLGSTGRYRTNVWDYPGANSFGASRAQDLADHPTVKPVALVADAIRDVTRHGDIVIDAFLGSGTTILAAERTKRIAYGIEIDPGYVDVALRRWSQMTGEEPVLDVTGERFSDVAARRALERGSEAVARELVPVRRTGDASAINPPPRRRVVA